MYKMWEKNKDAGNQTKNLENVLSLSFDDFLNFLLIDPSSHYYEL